MIPESIKRDHVIEALAHIDASSVPSSRQSADYDLHHEGKKYPPKYVITVASKFATGERSCLMTNFMRERRPTTF